jgi:hypothetical protein
MTPPTVLEEDGDTLVVRKRAGKVGELDALATFGETQFGHAYG